MDAVNAFNMELFSMIEMKPPISRAKMMSVTKSAIKAIKLYKHVVQIVEKFIKKCKPELKVPGLYVVDSIVRQSRHQFGVEKDVFGPRFLKNFPDTFQNLFLCPEDDKSKIIRVLNLWQKNGVFDMAILQPLMDLANGTLMPSPVPEVPCEPQPEPAVAPAPAVPNLSNLPSSDALAAVAQLFQSPHGQELQRMLQNIQQADRSVVPNMSNIPQAVPQMPQFTQHSADAERRNPLAEKLLDRFEYDDEPDDPKKEITLHPQGMPENSHLFHPMANMHNVHPHLMGQTAGIEHGGMMNHGNYQRIPDIHHPNDVPPQLQENSREDSSSRRDNRHRGHGRRSRSGSRSPRRRRSRSSSRSRRSRHRRSRSRSRDRTREHRRSRSQDRAERELERERRQKGLPSIKSQTLSVCSTTLWVGQLDKKTQQTDVTSLLEEFGQIESINMIPPRGCAYIVMVHRTDAYTALNKLSRGSYKVNQKPVKIAWALNKGIKQAHKKLWDVERGVTYIPWSKVKVDELESYREGGMFDPDTLSPEWKHLVEVNKPVSVNGLLETLPADGPITAPVQVPPVQQATPPLGSPGFSSPIMMSPTSMPPVVPPSFIPAELAPANLPGAGNANPPEEVKMEKPPNLNPELGSPPGPGVTPAGLPRPGLPPPMQPPPGMPPFLPPPNMPPHMMPPNMFMANRFRMPMNFPPAGPPFPRPMRSDGINLRPGMPFRNLRPGFGPPPPFQRGTW
ncbi:SR-related and CTD-associated factor 4-like [Synchiropus splendidus]|uniref:SR-related and CTD-associated factor 4-like n=1 Tax=Synchiropus splendidus TaxID=270530 RepID=UPI00237D8617|nr:SR-related and CTD-associated factor 4-like [Synchiropus splendidus]